MIRTVSLRSTTRRSGLLLASALAALCCLFMTASPALSDDAGVQVSRNGSARFITKDVGSERWSISKNQDGSVTGNIFFSDGSPPSFVECDPRGSSGTDVSLACWGADACTSWPCENQWGFISDVTLPAAFFEPPGAPGPAPTPAPTPRPLRISDLVGAYELVAFTVRYDTGVTLTQDNVNSYSGTWSITPSGAMTQRFTINGETSVATGSMVVLNDTSLRIMNDQVACNSTLSFSLDGETLRTTLPTGTCGVNFSETDTWRRVSARASNGALGLRSTTETDMPGVAGLLAGEITRLDEDQ